MSTIGNILFVVLVIFGAIQMGIMEWEGMRKK